MTNINPMVVTLILLLDEEPIVNTKQHTYFCWYDVWIYIVLNDSLDMILNNTCWYIYARFITHSRKYIIDDILTLFWVIALGQNAQNASDWNQRFLTPCNEDSDKLNSIVISILYTSFRTCDFFSRHDLNKD